MPANVSLLGWGLPTAWGLVSLTLEVAPVPGGPAALNAFTSLASLVGCALILVARGRLGIGGSLFRTRGCRPSTHNTPDGSNSCPDTPGGTRRRRLAWGLALATSACTLANQAALGFQAPVALAVAAQAGASLTYIGLMCLWFLAYVPRDPQQIEEGAIWSTALCAVVLLAATLLPYPAALTLCVALPPASALCLCLVIRTNAASASARCPSAPDSAPFPVAPGTLGTSDASDTLDANPGPSSPGNRASRVTALASMLGVIAFGLVFGLPANLAGLTAAGTNPLLIRLSNLGGLALAAVLALWYVTSARRIDLSSLFRMLYPLAAVGLFLAALPSAPISALGIGLAMAGQWALYVFVWINAVEGCRAAVNTQTTGVFARARISFDTGGLLAGCVGMLLPAIMRGTQPSEATIPLVLFGALVVFALVNALVFRSGSTRDPIAEPECAPVPDPSRQATPVPGDAEGALAALARARASQLAHDYGLSERESQILERLLRGYSTAAIRNELAIAKGTVDTYIQRIYRKCGVHARQELVDLAEGHPGHEQAH